MKGVICIIALLWGSFLAYSQTTIAKQSFETSGDTWTPLTFSTPPCTVGNDIWDYTTGFSVLTPNDGSQFWGIRDLDGSCGGSGFETITFPNVNIAANSNVIFSFDYYAVGMDNNDDLKYELFYDNISQGEVVVVDGVRGRSDNTNGWVTETVSVPSSVTNVSLILSARSNANNDRAGFDNVILFESSIANDNCSTATTLIVGTDNTQNVVTGDNTLATSSGELPNPTCGNYLGRDLWYTATVPATGILTIETNSSAIDTAIEVYSGSCGNLTQISCNDDISFPGNLNSRIELTGLPNTTVYIRVWSYNNATSGTFDIVAYSNPPPENNDCSNATTLVVGTSNTENVVTGTNVGATGSNPPPNPNCDAYAGGDVWYTATIPASGLLNIETSDAGGITDTGVAVYTGSCGSLTQIDCDADSGPGFFSTINLTGLPNTTVYIRVWEYQNNNFGEFNIVAYSPECPFSTTWNGNNWNNGVPNSFTSAVINGDYTTGTDGSFDACNCTVNNGDILTVSPNTYVRIDNDLTVNGVLEVEHEGSLVMVQDDGAVAASGTINIHKTTTPIELYDYTYWSSPMTNETIGNVFTESPSGYIYRFEASNFSDISPDDGFDDDGDVWVPVSGSTTMDVGHGYAVMGPLTGSFPRTQSVIFNGILNNGIITEPIVLSANPADNDDDFNLIGNPYASGIDAEAFLNESSNSAIIGGSVYLWTHNTPVSSSNPGPNTQNYATNDYAIYTVGTGGIAAGSGGVKPDGIIASGQGFFVEGLSAGSITFNNSMRVITGNNQFFRGSGSKNAVVNEKERIWLNLYNDQGAFNQILIGFIEGATKNSDREFDALRLQSLNPISFYSFSDNKEFAIQGLAPIQNNEEIIRLGFNSKIEEAVSFTINIDELEGNLNEYTIYLIDKYLNSTHDLQASSYSFSVDEPGNYNDRFELLLKKSGVLSNEDVSSLSDELLLINKENHLEIKTANRSLITSLQVYDILGKTFSNSVPDSDRFKLDISNIRKGTVLLINATLEGDHTITKKFLIN